MEPQTSRAIIRSVIADVTNKIRPKMLVFGLAYDSELWSSLTYLNTYFVEDNPDYIDVTPVSSTHLLLYDYGDITVERSYSITDTELQAWPLPEGLLKKGPFDIILIQGPPSYNKACPGRLLPIYWSSNLLSKPGTVVYVDDSRRSLEAYCIDRFFHDNIKTAIAAEGGCMRIQI